APGNSARGLRPGRSWGWATRRVYEIEDREGGIRVRTTHRPQSKRTPFRSGGHPAQPVDSGCGNRKQPQSESADAVRLWPRNPSSIRAVRSPASRTAHPSARHIPQVNSSQGRVRTTRTRMNSGKRTWSRTRSSKTCRSVTFVTAAIRKTAARTYRQRSASSAQALALLPLGAAGGRQLVLLPLIPPRRVNPDLRQPLVA